MARCGRCNKFMLFLPQSGYCRNCELLNEKDRIVEEARKAEEDRLRLAEEARKVEEEKQHLAEERRRIAEEAAKAEQERLRKIEEAAKAEQERLRKIEEARKAEEERLRKAEEARKAEEERKRKAEEARKAEEERKRKAEEARKAVEERKAEEEQHLATMTVNQQVVHTLRNDFAQLFPQIKNNCLFKESKDGYFDHEFGSKLDGPIINKRKGKFVEANKEFANLALSHRAFTPNIARCWFKTLAAAGDLTDALAVLDYAIEKMKIETGAKGVLRNDLLSIINPIYNNDIDGLISTLVAWSGNPMHHLQREDLWYTADDEYANAILANTGVILKSRLLDEHIRKTLGSREYLYIPLKKLQFQTQDNVFNPVSKGDWFTLIGYLCGIEQDGAFLCILDSQFSHRPTYFFTRHKGRISDRQFTYALLGILAKMGVIDDSAITHAAPQKDEAMGIEESEKVRINSFNTKIAGVTYSNVGANTENRQKIIQSLLGEGLLNQGQELKLKPEPYNPYDHQAVAVYGPDERQLGYLPKEFAHKIFDKLSATNNYSCVVSNVTGGSAGMSYGVNVRIDEYTSVSGSSHQESKVPAVDVESI